MKIGVVLLAKNEQRIIPEWLAFYHAHGFDRIHVFDNESQDATAEMVRASARRFDGITLEVWPIIGDFNAGQVAAYNRGLEIMGRDGVDWCLFVDADEFLVCTNGSTVKNWLATLDRFSAIALHWSFYGSSGHAEMPPGLIIENFLYRAPASFWPQSLCKSFVRIPDTDVCANPHLFLRGGEPVPYVNCKGGPVQWESFGQDHVITPWRVNHYFVRSKDWWRQKMLRSSMAEGFVRSDEDWAKHDRNEHYDPAALVYVRRVKAALVTLGFTHPEVGSANDHLADLCLLQAQYHFEKHRQSILTGT